MITKATVALIASAGVCASAQAQLTVGFDINGFSYAFKDAGGVGGFGGESHTGTLEWSFRPSPATVIAAVRTGTDGQFGALTPVALGASLADFSGSFVLESGYVKSGSFNVELDNGDTYTAEAVGDSGNIQSLLIGQYTLDGLTFEGAFSDDAFGSVDVAPFFAAQGGPGGLAGSFFKFSFLPMSSGAGNGDIEVFVTVPLPPAAYAGMATLAGAIGLSWVRRRR